MIETTLINYSYPQKGIIEIVTGIGTYTKFKGMILFTGDGIKFQADGLKIFAKKA